MSPEDAVAQAGGGVIWDEAFPYTEGKAPLTGRYANSSGGGKSGGHEPQEDLSLLKDAYREQAEEWDMDPAEIQLGTMK